MDLHGFFLYNFTISKVQGDSRCHRKKENHSGITYERRIFAYFYSAAPLSSGITKTTPHFSGTYSPAPYFTYMEPLGTATSSVIMPLWPELTDPK